MDELITWRRHQLDERERESCGWVEEGLEDWLATHYAERELRDIEAKRRILGRYERVGADPTKNPAQEYALAERALRRVVEDLASIYASQPGWRDESQP